MTTMFQVAELHESPTNPRKIRDAKKDAELTESIRAHGIRTPLLLRERDKGGFEVVCGSRRLRSARALELGEVPGDVQELDDALACEIQCIENAQREDVHPLDQADAYRRLVDQYGYDVDRLAARVGREKAVVKRALKLGELGKDGRAAYVEGKLSPDAAFVLARVPSDLQGVVLKEALALWAKRWVPKGEERGPMSGEDMRDLALRRSLHLLTRAPFDVADVTLAPKAGACTSCPKQTGAQADLFGDVEGDSQCTDPACWRDKCGAEWERVSERVTKPKEQGGLVAKLLLPTESKKLFDGDHERVRYDSKFVGLDEMSGSYPEKKVRSYFKKDELPPVTYAQRPSDGAPVALIARADFERARNKHARAGSGSGIRTEASDSKARAKRKADNAARKAEEALRATIEARVVEVAVGNAEARAFDSNQLRAMIEVLVEDAGVEGLERMSTRRKLEQQPHEKPLDRFDKHFELVRRACVDASDKVLRGLLLELVLVYAMRGGQTTLSGDAPEGVTICKLLGVDVKTLAAAAKKEAANAHVGKEKKTATPGTSVAAKGAKPKAAGAPASKGKAAGSKAAKKKGGRR